MQPVQPILVPMIVSQASTGSLPRLQPSDLPCPISLCGDRGPGTPLPATSMRLTFHRGGQIGADPVHQDFTQYDHLLEHTRWEDIEGLPNDLVRETRALFWDRLTAPTPSDAWDLAQVACGLTELDGKTPWGAYRVHVLGPLVTYSRKVAIAGASPFLRADELKDAELADKVSAMFSPDRRVVLISWVQLAAASSHAHLSMLETASEWLAWLSDKEGWEPFADPVLLRPSPH